MSARRIVAVLLVLCVMGSQGFVSAVSAQPGAGAPPAGSPSTPSSEATPPRVSYLNGDASFWRPGAQDWAAAQINMPLAPGDVLYTGGNGNAEIQIGPRAFVRAAEGTQIGLDNQEPNYVQFRVTGGYAGVDLRDLTPGQTVEIDTPNAAFTIERPGYYRFDVGPDTTKLRTHRGGSATVTPAGGTPMGVAGNQQIVVTGTEAARVEAGAPPQLTAWDRWNYQRTDSLLQPASTRYVPPTVYGAESLDRYGSWRTVDTYGAVWVPSAVAVGWVPYTTGHWIWDPRFGWTWLDDAPWGWAPYHYGRWVFVGGFWGWAPGPVIVAPVYSPALVVFLGGGVTISFGRPLCWAPLGWGEPIVPWWGRPGFIGVASWQGWGGPRVVNNVVINRTTTVNVTNINVYQNVNVTNAVVGVPADRFGRGQVRPTRIEQAEVKQLSPVHGALAVTPVAASLAPAASATVKPPAALKERPVVATRPPHDASATLKAQGVATTVAPAPAPAPKLGPSPKGVTPAPVPAQSPSATAPAEGKKEEGSKKEKATATPSPPVPPSAPAQGPKKEKATATPPPLPAPPSSPAETPKKEKATATPPPLPAPPSAPAEGPKKEKATATPPPLPAPPSAPAEGPKKEKATATPPPLPAPQAPPGPPEQKKAKPPAVSAPQPVPPVAPAPPPGLPEQKKQSAPGMTTPHGPPPPASQGPPAAQEQKKHPAPPQQGPGPQQQGPPPGQGGPPGQGKKQEGRLQSPPASPSELSRGA